METRSRSPDVAVIGAGIVGTAAASFLADAGARVRLYERTSIAAGASGRNSGIVQQPFDAVLGELYRASLTEYRTLAAEDGGFSLSDQPAGLLYLGRQPAVAEREAEAWSKAWPATRPAVVEGASLQRLEPALAPDLVACRLEIGFPLEPAAATYAFAAAGERRGVTTVLADARPAIVDRRVIGVRVGGRIEPAGAVLVAAGPWTPAVVERAGSWPRIRPIWGVVASLALAGAPRHALEAAAMEIEPGSPDPSDETPSADPPDPSDIDVDFSLVPAIGSSALGSTFLQTEPNPSAWLAALRRVGAGYVPAIADAPLIGLRHCARPASADGRPVLGAVPGFTGLFVAAGHGPWGISTGPGSARLIADLILGGIDSTGLPVAVQPGRFGPVQRQEAGLDR